MGERRAPTAAPNPAPMKVVPVADVRPNNPNGARRNGENAGNGGETHQTSADGFPPLTTQQGTPVADDQNTLKFGDRGPSALEDFHFREKVFHFDHERIPERVVHARGFGAHGYFENYDSLADVTRADLFQRPGAKTPAFVRFSTVAGNKGSFDLARDVRGFAVKLYTQEGNWDIVGNNIPVFFIQDAIKFPDLIHAAKQEPDRGFPQAQTAHDNFWDFVSLMPESTHMLMWTMSDRAIPRSFRFMEGFGVHTFRLINAEGRSTFVKFHWKPKLGLQSVVWNEAVKINGADPDFHRRDLWDAIQSGNFPEWELGLQLFDDDFADRFDFDVLDATKIIPEELVPVRRVGRLVLDRVVENFFAETEQVAFCTQNVVPGVDFTNDPLLQGRNFSYLDTQLKRLGSPNFTFLPVNAPKCPFATLQQDGHMATMNPTSRRELRAELVAERHRRSAGRSRTRLPFLPGAGGRDEAACAFRDVRRSLQPGAPVLRQPDAGRAAAHHRRVRIRAEQGRTTRHPCAHGRQSHERRRRPGDIGRRRARPRRRGRPVGARTYSDHRPRRRHRRSASCRTVPTVSRGGSWECSSPTRAMPVCSANCSRPP